jgi:hypothetical protein
VPADNLVLRNPLLHQVPKPSCGIIRKEPLLTKIPIFGTFKEKE